MAKLFNISIRRVCITVVIVCCLVFFLIYIVKPSNENNVKGEYSFLEKYLENNKDVFKVKSQLSAENQMNIHASQDDLNSYLLLKQEYPFVTYISALKNSVKVMHLPFTKTHSKAIDDCSKYKKPSLFHNQHSLELRFPHILSLMSEISTKYDDNKESGFYDIAWRGNRSDDDFTLRTLPAKVNKIQQTFFERHLTANDAPAGDTVDITAESRAVFEQPLFHYLQSFVYYIVYCSYKPRGKENWSKGADYLQEIADHVIVTPEWEENMGVNFISPASHPKSGPLQVHPATLNYFLRQTFLRTDFDFTGSRPKDVIVPYYVEYTQHREKYINSSSSSGSSSGGSSGGRGSGVHNISESRYLNGRSHLLAESLASLTERLEEDRVHRELEAHNQYLVVFVGSKNPPGGLREKFGAQFERVVAENGFSDVVYSTETTSHLAYKRLLFNSDFCLSVRGDTSSSGRLFSVIEAGCIPVIISDWVQLPFQSLIDYSQFTLTFPESSVHDVDALVRHLRGISPERKRRMQQALVDVRPLLLYEPSPSDCHLLNPVTLSLVESLLHRKRACDQFATPVASSPMCSNLLKRLQLASLRIY